MILDKDYFDHIDVNMKQIKTTKAKDSRKLLKAETAVLPKKKKKKKRKRQVSEVSKF